MIRMDGADLTAGPEESHLLEEVFGMEVVLLDGERETVFTILKEFSIKGLLYAVLQSETLRKEGEYAIFRVGFDDRNTPQLESIEDDDEWDEVSEIYDEMLYSGQTNKSKQ